MSEWSQDKQERANELIEKGACFTDGTTVNAIVDRIEECYGAIYGPLYDTTHLVLGALAEVTKG